MSVVQAADSDDLAAPRDAARYGRAAAMSQGKRALNGAGAPAFVVYRGGVG